MVRVFKTKTFQRWLAKSPLSDADLCGAVREMRSGLHNGKLGSALIKKRIALPGGGKRGGARTIVASNHGDRWFFLFGFEKSERENISPREEAVLAKVGGDLLGLTEFQVEKALIARELEEICHGET